MSRRVVGLIVAAAGAVLLFISAAADVIGLGSAGYFGNRQIIGTVLGVIAIAAGLLVAFLPSRRAGSPARGAGRPAQPIKHRRKG
jgi:nicotinamide riboside transporter PnuC